jgi:hypothetical protein
MLANETTNKVITHEPYPAHIGTSYAYDYITSPHTSAPSFLRLYRLYKGKVVESQLYPVRMKVG